MSKDVELHTYRVFTNKQTELGNPVGIILDTKREIDDKNRQSIASKTGFSETIFINSLDTKNISIFTPKREIPFAGHAVLGCIYFFNERLDQPIEYIESKKGKIKTWQQEKLIWIETDLKNTPSWNHEQLSDYSLVENFPSDKSPTKVHTMIWSWINENKGTIRARTFAYDWGIPEDEANGSGSMQLAHILNKKLEIHHGKGSIIYTIPTENNLIELGGIVIKDKSKILTV